MAAKKPEIYYAGIVRRRDVMSPSTSPTTELSHQFYLKSFNRFTQGSYKEAMRFTANTVAERTPNGVRQEVEESNGRVFAYGSSAGVAAIVIATGDYPRRVAHSLLSLMVDEFTSQNPRTSYENVKADPNNKDKQLIPYPKLATHIVEYNENLDEVDKLGGLQANLDDTKAVLHKTIESVLERGEKIENLVAKSDGLSASSKMFYQSAKKQNSCCVVM